MQIELGRALLEIFNFPRSRALFRHRFSHCLGLPEKQTGIDFLSPRVFLGVPHWEEPNWVLRVFHEVWGVCVCMLLIIFPRLRCFFR